MKKSLIVLVSLFSVLIISGCAIGKETIKCTSSTEQSGFTIATNQTLIIESGKITRLTSQLTSTASDSVKDYFDEYIKVLEAKEQGFGGLDGLSGVTYTTKKDGNKHVVNIDILYSKVKPSEYQKLNATVQDLFADRGKIISSTKTVEEMESQGYKCTIS